MVVPPTQIVEGVAVAVTVGLGLTVTTTVAVAVQVPNKPVRVYVCVLVGFAATLVPVVTLRPVEGAHV